MLFKKTLIKFSCYTDRLIVVGIKDAIVKGLTLSAYLKVVTIWSFNQNDL